MLYEGTEQNQEDTALLVLILVMMEDALWAHWKWQRARALLVLILVMMEDALWADRIVREVLERSTS